MRGDWQTRDACYVGVKGSIILSDRPCGLIMANLMPRKFSGLLLREAKRDARVLPFVMHTLLITISGDRFVLV